MLRRICCTGLLFFVLSITINCYAQNMEWLKGTWSGKAFFSGSDASQYYILMLRVFEINKTKFEGVISTIEPSDTSIRYDARISGIVYDNYLIIERYRIFYVKNAKNARWQLSCSNCKQPRMLFSIESGKFVFRGEEKDCYKECNGTREFSKDINDFDSLNQKTLYALAGAQPPSIITTAVAKNTNEQVKDSSSSLKEEDAVIQRIPVLPAGKIVSTSMKQDLLLTYKPPGALTKNSSPLIKQNDLYIPQFKIPSSVDTIALTSTNNKVAIQKPPLAILRNTTSLLPETLLPQLRIPSSVDTIALTAKINNASSQKQLPVIHRDTVSLLPAGYAERTKKVIRTLTVNTDSITLRVYDNGIVDGDIVSVVYNDKVVIDKLSLTSNAFIVKIPVSATGINSLVFHAHNLGEFPPNTARLEILYGNKQEVLTISSDYTVSSAIDIIYQSK